MTSICRCCVNDSGLSFYKSFFFKGITQELVFKTVIYPAQGLVHEFRSSNFRELKKWRALCVYLPLSREKLFGGNV